MRQALDQVVRSGKRSEGIRDGSHRDGIAVAVAVANEYVFVRPFSDEVVVNVGYSDGGVFGGMLPGLLYRGGAM